MRGRFAPSPTGDLHLGNARTALLAWLQPRSAGGCFVLRVEDLDFGRVRPGIMERQLAELRWLGLDWDEGPDVGGAYGPYEQSRRQPLYEEAIRKLSSMGLVYECFCSRREILSASSAPHASDDEGPPYSRRCRTLTREELAERRARGPAALRLRVAEGEISFDDQLAGSVSYQPAAECGDFVIRRKDGVAAYQLAVVVDDAAMEITDILRGADLLPSTARQLLLYSALALDPPRFTHVPLITGSDGERLAKRHGAPSLRELRERATPPDVVVGWLAASCGLAAVGERVTPAELVGSFSLARITDHRLPLLHLP